MCDWVQGRNEGQLATGVLGQAPGRVSESRAWQNLKQSEREGEREGGSAQDMGHMTEKKITFYYQGV